MDGLVNGVKYNLSFFHKTTFLSLQVKLGTDQLSNALPSQNYASALLALVFWSILRYLF